MTVQEIVRKVRSASNLGVRPEFWEIFESSDSTLELTDSGFRIAHGWDTLRIDQFGDRLIIEANHASARTRLGDYFGYGGMGNEIFDAVIEQLLDAPPIKEEILEDLEARRS